MQFDFVLHVISDSSSSDSDVPPEKRSRMKYMKEVEKEKKISQKKLKEVGSNRVKMR